MDDHTAYVELLAELEGARKAPVSEKSTLRHLPGTMISTDYLWTQGATMWPCTYTNAHNAIRVAAEDMLREWCRENKKTFGIDEGEDHVACGYPHWDYEGGFVTIGTGPTLAVALLNAVRSVRGMKETA